MRRNLWRQGDFLFPLCLALLAVVVRHSVELACSQKLYLAQNIGYLCMLNITSSKPSKYCLIIGRVPGLGGGGGEHSHIYAI